MKIEDFEKEYIKKIKKDIKEAKEQLEDEDLLFELEEEIGTLREWESFLSLRGYL